MRFLQRYRHVWTIWLSITLAYAFLTVLSLKLLLPLQFYVFGELPYSISLLFFPHGLRIIVAYFYRWQSIPYLFPVSLYYALQFHYPEAPFTTVLLVAVLVSSVGYIGLIIALIIKSIFFPGLPERKDWITMLIAGGCASVLNTLGHKFLLGIKDALVLGYLIGDISGLFFLLVSLIYAFRHYEKLSLAVARVCRNRNS
jgi:hypothetical protein